MNNILQMLEKSVQQYGTRPALWDPVSEGGYQCISYDMFWEDVRRIAGQLHEVGVTRNQQVGLLSNSRAWWPICDVSIMSLGAVTVPIYPTLPANQMAYIIRHSEMVGLALQDMNQLKKIVSIPPEEIPDLQFVLVLDGQRDDDLLGQARKRFQVYFYEEWLSAPHLFSMLEWKSGWDAISPESLATIVFTSGTTGLPKGVLLTHENIVANVEGVRDIVPMYPTDRSLSYLPLSHIFERTCGQFYPLSLGSSIAYSHGFHQILQDFQEMPPTIFTTVPRLLEKVQEGALDKVAQAGGRTEKIFRWALNIATEVRVEQKRFAPLRMKIADKLVFSKLHQLFGGQLQRIVSGGAPLPKHVGRFFTAAGLAVAEGYGMTETSPVISANRPSHVVLGTAGVILDNVQVKIAEDGEILVKGPSISKGYYKDPESTAETITEDGWLRTGDIGAILEGNLLQITDRKKNLIVLSTGKKVTPAPIENDIVKSRVIEHAVLVGQNQKYITAIVSPDEEAVKQWYESKGVSVPPREAWPLDEHLHAYFMQEVHNTTASYAKFEQPKKIIISKEAFTVDNGLMTPSLKARGKAILSLYQAEILAMYEDGASSETGSA